MLDETLAFITRASWILFLVAVVLIFFRTLFDEGFVAALKVLFGRAILIGLLVILSLAALDTSLTFIQPQEIGVVVSLFSSEGVRDRPFRAGLRWIIPLAERIYLYPIYWQTYTMSGRPLEGQELGDDAIVARTSDGQEVIIDCSVIFRIDSEQVIRIHIDWQNRYIDDFVRPIVRGIVRTEVSQFTIDEVNSSKRQDIEARLDSLVRAELEDKGFIMDSFVLRNITFSDVYAASVEQKQVALAEVTREAYRARQIEQIAGGRANEISTIAAAEATAIVVKATAEAIAIQVKAQAEATALSQIAAAVAAQPDLLTYEYINKISPSLRVMLLPNNAPFLLPLPDLLQDSAAVELTPSATPILAPTLTPTPSITATPSITTTIIATPTIVPLATTTPAP